MKICRPVTRGAYTKCSDFGCSLECSPDFVAENSGFSRMFYFQQDISKKMWTDFSEIYL